MARDISPEALSEMLGLRSAESEMLKSVLENCGKTGLSLGGAGAAMGAAMGATTVPVVGAVPGWLVGFALGYLVGWGACSGARRYIVIEGLKQSLSDAGMPVSGDRQAIALLRSELDRLSNPERPNGFKLPEKMHMPIARQRGSV